MIHADLVNSAIPAVFPVRAHRAPDPAPFEEPPSDPFEPADPHQAPIRTPQNDEPVPDHNPSVLH